MSALTTRWASLQLPVFVYGTLRRGQSNYWLLRGNTVTELPATFVGGRLYSFRTFPVLIEDDPAAVVIGELMWLHPAYYNRILPELDRLEGYDPTLPHEACPYWRVQRRVTVRQNAQAWAWMYVGNLALLATMPHELIASGDWIRFQRERVRRMFGDA